MKQNLAGPADAEPAMSPGHALGAALLSRRGVATILLVVGILAITFALVSGGLAAQKRRVASQELYSRTLEVMGVGRETLSSLQDLELGQRGYLLTRDEAYLEPYLRADGRIEAQLEAFRQLTRDSPARQEILTRLSDQVIGLRSSLAQGIELGRAGEFDAAIAAMRTDASKRIMDDIRGAMNMALAEEERMLVQRRADSGANGRTLGLYLLGLMGAGLVLIAFSVFSAFSALAFGARADMERERTAAALRLAGSERRFRIMTEAMPQIVWASDQRGRFDFVNARWQAYTGSPGTQEQWIDHIHPDDRAGIVAAWRHSLASGETYAREIRLRAADLSYRWFLCRAVPVRDGSGQIEQWLGTGTDIHEAKLNLEARELLSQELSHRIKNIFSVVGSLIALSARADPGQAAFAQSLRDRIAALGRAHEFVRPHSPASAARGGKRTFSAFIADLLGAYSDPTSERIRFSGEDFTFGDKSATPLALFFHELGTNAAKYGALSTQDGGIDISAARAGEDVIIEWRERGGPPVNGDPSREGFGTTLARLSVEGQLGGSIDKVWEGEGLRVRISVPAATLAQA
ncbi:MAG: CHASE3 domain-containing protein [Alphaproteobacteria bacterium]|nr:CHASE3 domain-containing protein [Alphaproteobacteria bacterium]